MKKRFSEPKWRAASKRRSLDELNRRRAHKKWLKFQRRIRVGVSKEAQLAKHLFEAEETIAAPTTFSFIKNPDEMISFFEAIGNATRRGRNVYVDMDEITSMSPEAIAVYLSIIGHYTYLNGRNIKGAAPSDPDMRAMFTLSGFYKHVRSNFSKEQEDHGSIKRRKSYKVESQTARDLIQFASNNLYGEKRKCPGVYRTLIECMNNTVNHAAKREGSGENWWATVSCPPGSDVARFTFIDTGVGIFESVRIKDLKKRFALAFGLRDNSDILLDILEGRIGSRTGLSYRGKGLPSIYQVLLRGQLSNLVIISNDVFADVQEGVFRAMKQPFEGTFIYWELAR